MSEPVTPEERPVEAEPEEPETLPLPRWVPVLIGLVLVTMAALAVVTGLRYRENTFSSVITPRREPRAQTTRAAPPGEPEAGASLVISGDAGDAVPVQNPPVTGEARAEISGGPGGVNARVRMWAKRGMVLNVLPDDAVVYVNDVAIGHANQFNTVDEVYDFANPGSYTIRVVAPGYREQQFTVTAADDAQQELARISAKLEKE